MQNSESYEPEVDDYVIWDRGKHGRDEGWVYFKGDPVDNELRRKQGWNPVSQYITIETGVKDKKECVYTSGKPMRHKKVHTLLLCNKDYWSELKYVKNRRKEPREPREPDYTMYKSQERPLDY